MAEKQLSDMTVNELESFQNQREEELRIAMDNFNTVNMEYLDLSKEVKKLENMIGAFKEKMIDLAKAKRMATHNRERIESELREAKSRFFATKRGI
jgi:predicted  nucleic acid-binding Zn-ribbon protein